MAKHCFVILVAILLLSTSVFSQQQDGSVLERRVTINQQNQPLSVILNLISWQAGVYFSYNASLINANKSYSVDVTDVSVFTVLNQLFPAKNFVYTELENQIVLTPNSLNYNKQAEKNDSIPVKYFFLSGKIIDNKKQNPIKYASVSVLHKPLGTITNIDGDFLLKLHPDNILDTVVISCMGFAQKRLPAYKILDQDIFVMNPVSIRIKEVKVTAISTSDLLKKIRENIELNYGNQPKLLSAFYRETVKQDGNYINVSEAVLEILKAPVSNSFRTDDIRLLKGRRSPDVQPFQWLNFKLQGGPFTITKLDVVKSMETFINKEYQNMYTYTISKVIWFKKHPVYVVQFKPAFDTVFPGFVGEMYVHRETFAIVHASFRLTKKGLKNATTSMIKKKPRGVKAHPSFVQYTVNYQQYKGKWYLATAQASVKFKVRSRRDKINSEFHSISDILITDIRNTDLKRFTKKETFSHNDIFVEMINSYDSKFWENYNIIKPDEDLRRAFKNNIFNPNYIK